jgi:small conductance mechanosensitive channel
MPEFLSVEYLQALATEYLVPFVINMALALVVFVVGRIVARAVVRLIDRLMERSKVDASLRKFLGSLSYALLLVIVVIATLERLGVQTTAAVAVLGAAGLAIGLALQGSLGNFASGVMLIVFKPFRVGDVVQVAGQIGTVNAIDIFNTEITTADNRKIIVPNGQVTGGIIENITAHDTRRIDMVFGVGYGDDIEKARKLILGVLQADPRVLAEPVPLVAVAELADSSVNFFVRPWCATTDYWSLKFALTERIKQQFDDNGVTIPFPQRDVHLHQAA